MMAVKFEDKSKRRKDDAINLLILLFIASLLGVYLIATTFLIAKDGVYYIERAQKLSSDPVCTIKDHPPGYPILIFAAHKFVTLFTDNSSVFTWIYTAQSVTLLCRLIALIPLYLIGKFLVGSRRSFWAILILIILPYPTEFGIDALRDWPHILFLAAGFLFLLWGAKQGKWWMFGIAGMAAGLGSIIRPECVQLVVYGILWLLVRLVKPKSKMSRPKLLCALFILLIGFAFLLAPYVGVAGRMIPPKLGAFFDFAKEHVADSHNYINTIVSLFGNITKAIGKLIEDISDNLMYFFVPALVIGIYSHFHKQSMATDIERFFVPVFIVLNVIIIILLYCSYEYIERRHCLPLVMCLIFYVPIGLQILADWLSSRFSKGRSGNKPNPQLWFFILVAVGVAICLPKLLRPLRIEKQGYRVVSRWLSENTGREDIVAVIDQRIAFYAERSRIEYIDNEIASKVKYVVRIERSENQISESDTVLRKEYFSWVDMKKKEKKLVIYKVL